MVCASLRSPPLPYSGQSVPVLSGPAELRAATGLHTLQANSTLLTEQVCLIGDNAWEG